MMQKHGIQKHPGETLKDYQGEVAFIFIYVERNSPQTTIHPKCDHDATMGVRHSSKIHGMRQRRTGGSCCCCASLLAVQSN